MVTSTTRKASRMTRVKGCTRKMSNTCAIFTTDGLAAAGYPTEGSASPSALLKAATVAADCGPPDTDWITLSPMRIDAVVPGAADSCEYMTEARARAPFATSQ